MAPPKSGSTPAAHVFIELTPVRIEVVRFLIACAASHRRNWWREWLPRG
jgi:hypothetical protein